MTKLIKSDGKTQNQDDGKSLNKLLSEQHSRTLFVFSEGECESVVADLTHLYLNDTPIKNANGSLNFPLGDFEIQARNGTKNQTVMSGYQNSEKEIPVGVELKKDIPVIRTVTDPNVKKVRITVGVKGLYYQPEGVADTWGTFAFIVVSAGSISQVVKFDGLSREQYLQQIELDVSSLTAPFNIKVERTNDDSDSMRMQNDTFWASYTEIIPSNLNYPHTALLGLQLNSKSFGSFPRVNARVRGIKVHVPSNYNPYSRTYTGLWDGRFKVAWTNNPAWIYYDLIMSPRYGLSKRIWSFACDKWAMYAVARYCDEIVPDGFGGSEPRFTCNVAIQDQRQAYDLLNDLASAFRGMPVWDGTQFAAVQDRPADPVWIYTNANVINGEFSYASAGLKARHNALHVEYLDKNDHYRKKTEYVADDQMIARYQLNVKKVVAFGCTSRGQAYRTGRWILETEKLESKTVTFSVGLEGLKHVPSDIIEVADENYAGTKIGGRVLSVKGLLLELDREIEYITGASLRIHAKDGNIQKVNIVAVEGKTVTLASAVDVEPMSVWTYHGKIKPRLFRCLSIEEKDGIYTITALQHEPQKERIVDAGANFERVEYTAFSAPKLTHLSVSSFPGGGLSISWNSTAAAGKITYEVKVMKNGRIYAVYKNLTSLDLALQDLPNGEYTIIISIIGERGEILDQKQDVFVVDRPPVPQEVMISGGLTDITLNWKFVDKYTHTEIWAHTQDNQADALMVAKVFGSTFTHNIGAEQVRYYWLRHTRGQNVGYFHQARGLRGETAVDIDKELRVLNKKLSQNIVDQVIDTALPARKLGMMKYVKNPDLSKYQGQNLIYDEVANKQYMWNGTKYIPMEQEILARAIKGIIQPNQLAPIPTTQLSGKLTDAQIQSINATKVIGALNISTIPSIPTNKLTGLLTDDQIASLSATKINGTLDISKVPTIPTTKLTGTVSAKQISANAIGANHIATNAVTSDNILANAITTVKIASNSIVADKIATNAVTTDKINANAITAVKIATNAIEANKIKAGAIVAGKIASNAVVADNIAINAVTAVKIQAGAITAEKLSANSVGANAIQANAVTADKLSANAVTAGKIQAGAINANHLQAGQISADKLTIGLGGNLLYNPIFATATGIQPNGWDASIVGDKVNLRYISYDNPRQDGVGLRSFLPNERCILMHCVKTPSPNSYLSLNISSTPVVAESYYMFSFYYGGHTCVMSTLIRAYSKDDVDLGVLHDDRIPVSGSFNGIAGALRHAVKVKVPADTAYINISLRALNCRQGAHLFLARPMLEECTQYTTQPSAWVNAGVTAIHGGSIITETVTAQKLAANAVTANKIAAGSVSTHHIAANTINANHVQAKVLSADKLNIQKLSAISADLGDVRAGSININNRFVVSGDGRVEIRNQTANVGMVINNDNICVYDEVGRLRVKLGRL